jgi:hypothetical protein
LIAGSSHKRYQRIGDRGSLNTRIILCPNGEQNLHVNDRPSPLGLAEPDIKLQVLGLTAETSQDQQLEVKGSQTAQ